jgi:3'(2'), 5'-bisphosphate nucleotidase
MSYQQQLMIAIAAAEAASHVIMRHYQEFEKIPDAAVDITTAADIAAQDVIVERLRAAFPDDGIHAEEDRPYMAEIPKRNDRFWVIDPIDGTRGFARKTDEFSVMIGLVVDGAPVVGVVAEPCWDRLTWAILGGGCWTQMGEERGPRQVTTHDNGTLSTALFVMSRGSRISDDEYREFFGFRDIRRSYSSGVKLAAVARGEVDAYVSGYHEYSDYDMCAGQILVTEAGGQVSDFTGAEIIYPQPGTTITRGIVASNGTLHPEILERTRKKPW